MFQKLIEVLGFVSKNGAEIQWLNAGQHILHLICMLLAYFFILAYNPAYAILQYH